MKVAATLGGLALGAALVACGSENRMGWSESPTEPEGPSAEAGSDASPSGNTGPLDAGHADGGDAATGSTNDATTGDGAGLPALPTLGTYTLSGGCERPGSGQPSSPTTVDVTIVALPPADVFLTVNAIQRAPGEEFPQIDPFAPGRGFAWSSPFSTWNLPQDLQGFVVKNGSVTLDQPPGAIPYLVIRGSMLVDGSPYSNEICRFSLGPAF